MAPPAKKGAKPVKGKAAAGRKPAPGKRLIVHSGYDDEERRLVSRPPYRRVFVDRGPQWLVLEPHRMGLAAGGLFMALVVAGYTVLGWLGTPIAPSGMVVGAFATFVISYAAVGVFVWYLLLVADREFGPQVEKERKTRSLLELSGVAPTAAAAEAAAGAAEMEPESEAVPEAAIQAEENE